MLRWIALGCCLILAGPQDPADNVKALVDKLGSEDITEREQAQAELIKAGPSILPALRLQVASAEGERKGRIESIIAKLERAERLARLMEPGPFITLKCKDRPASEVLAELSKQSRVQVDGSALPAGTVLSLEADKLSLAAAIDDLCGRHGKIVPRWSATKVSLVPGTFVRRPFLEAGPFRFIPDGFLWTLTRGFGVADADFTLQGVLVGPPGRLPPGARLEILSAADDQGTDLGKTDEQAPLSLNLFQWSASGARRVWVQFENSPDLDASKLAKCQGRLRLTFVLETKRTLSVKAVVGAGGGILDDEHRLHPHRISRDGRTLSLSYYALIQVEEGGAPPPSRWLVLHDSKGRRLEGEARHDYALPCSSGLADSNEMLAGTLRFQLPDDFEPETLDLMEAVEVEEVVIPFELGGTPVK